jgi:hypothetical protein
VQILEILWELQIVTLDIDPIREPETPSTDQELKNALEVAEFIRNWFSKRSYVPPIRAMTGNGVCLYFCTPYYEITDANRDEVTRALEKFEQNCRKKFKEILKEKNCQIDRMFDLPRIGKVIGTMSVKGENTKKGHGGFPILSTNQRELRIKNFSKIS